MNKNAYEGVYREEWRIKRNPQGLVCRICGRFSEDCELPISHRRFGMHLSVIDIVKYPEWYTLICQELNCRLPINS